MALEVFKSARNQFEENLIKESDKDLTGIRCVPKYLLDGEPRFDVKIFHQLGDICMLLNGIKVPTTKINVIQDEPEGYAQIECRFFPTSLDLASNQQYEFNPLEKIEWFR